MTRFTLLALLLLTALSLDGQEPLTEKSVQITTTFIEANKERILGRADKAEALYLEVLKQDPARHAAAYELARLYAVAEDYDQALKYAEMASELDPANSWYQRFQADILQHRGEYIEAASIYEVITRDNPGEDYNYYKWAYLLVQGSQFDKALKVYQELEKRIGVNEELSRRKHTLYLGMGDYKKAAQELEKLIAAYPENLDYIHLLAGFYRQVGDTENARLTYERILQINPRDPNAAVGLNSLSKPSDNSDLGYLYSLKAIFLRPDVDIDTKIKQLMPYLDKLGNPELVEPCLELAEILRITHPADAKAFAISGDILYTAGQPSEALQQYRQTLQFDDAVYLVWEQILQIQAELGQFTGLIRDAEAAMELFPNQASIFFFHGWANDRLGNARTAVSSLEQAAAMSGKNANLKAGVLARLAIAYQHAGQLEKAQTTLDQALALAPGHPLVLNNLALFLATAGNNLEQARQRMAQSLAIQPNSPEFIATDAWLYYRGKDYQQAQTRMQEAFRQGGDQDPLLLERYGDILFQLNDPEGALQFWQKAQVKGVKSQLLERKIADRKLYE